MTNPNQKRQAAKAYAPQGHKVNRGGTKTVRRLAGPESDSLALSFCAYRGIYSKRIKDKGRNSSHSEGDQRRTAANVGNFC